MNKEPKPYLLSIISDIDSIRAYRPTGKKSFIKDAKSQDAILMRLQDIGENLSKVRDGFPEFWDDNANEAWIKAIGLRNIIAHGYAEISLDIIWVLITRDLAPFKRSIQKLL